MNKRIGEIKFVMLEKDGQMEEDAKGEFANAIILIESPRLRRQYEEYL